MLQAIRNRATGWIAYIIIGLLIIPFALWGVNQYFGEAAPVDAAQVNDAPIPLREFQQAYQQRRQQLQRLLGENFDPALIDENRLKQEVIEQLVTQRVLSQIAGRRGFRVGDEQLAQALQSYEVFQRDGRFDRELYQRLLAAQGYTPAAFEQTLRRDLVSSQWQQGVMASAFVPAAELERLISVLTQKRELAYVVLPLARYRDSVSVDESAAATYFEENKSRFTEPEKARLRYLDLTLEQLAGEVPVSDDEIEAAYEDQRARYVREERRSASHILVEAAADADDDEKAAARARAEAIREAVVTGAETFDEALAEAAQTEGMEGAELGVIDQGMLDPAFESALYALENEGDVSEPVRTAFGYHIIRLDRIEPGETTPLAEVRDELVTEVRRRKAETRFYEAAEMLYNLSFEHPDSLEPAAAALGLTVAETDWLTRDQGEGVAALPAVREAAFGEEVLRRRLNSAPLEVAPDRVIVVRLLEHREPQPRSLEEARADIVEALREERIREALQDDVAKLKARAAAGEALEALAAEFGGELKSTGPTTRSAAEVEDAVLSEAFRLPEPVEGEVSVGTVTLANGDQAVVAVNKVLPGEPADMSPAERTALTQRLAGQRGADQFEALLDSLREQAEVVIYRERL